jgi:glycosyltransferase involved in cell wall biosynthesis
MIYAHVSKKPRTADVAVIILTYNEEANISQALGSVCGWARQVFVVDSFSNDDTLDIASRYPCDIVQNAFEDHARQRNFALSRLPIKSEWILFLDADEWVPQDLKQEITTLIASKPKENGFFIKWRLIWMGRWIKRGYYPTWILRLARHGKVRCEDRAVNEHLIVEGPTGRLANDFLHEDRKGVTAWIEKHNRYASREAGELLRNRIAGHSRIQARLFGSQAERKRWMRQQVWERLPPILRPFLYFFFRYVVRAGFLDGRAALIYHFLQALWFPLLIDVKYLELRMMRQDGKATVKRANGEAITP